jgi:hypothetical protein
MKIKTHKVIDTEWGSFCVSVTWVDTHCASATPDHGNERWTSYTPLDVEITDDDGKTISFFCPNADKLTSELDIYVAGLIESEELTVND